MNEPEFERGMAMVEEGQRIMRAAVRYEPTESGPEQEDAPSQWASFVSLVADIAREDGWDGESADTSYYAAWAWLTDPSAAQEIAAAHVADVAARARKELAGTAPELPYEEILETLPQRIEPSDDPLVVDLVRVVEWVQSVRALAATAPAQEG